MNVVAKTDIGFVRNENQDRVRAEKIDNDVVLAVLCDGMGGHNAGSDASELAVNTIFERISLGFKADYDCNKIRNLLVSAVCAANAVVFDASQKDESKSGMGTTCVLVLVKEGKAYFVNVGDSRAYIIDGANISQVTADHSMTSVYLDEKLKFVERKFITKAVGIEPKIEPDYFEFEIKQGAKILLCSDGLSNYCGENEMLEIISSQGMDDAVSSLIDFALKKGGNDNITVVLIGD